MRYDPARKLERNAMLAKYKREHPELSVREIGRAFNISRQRVYQILKYTPQRKEQQKHGS